MGRYQNSGAGSGTFDIKVLSQVGHPLPPAEFHVKFDDGEYTRGDQEGPSSVPYLCNLLGPGRACHNTSNQSYGCPLSSDIW